MRAAIYRTSFYRSLKDPGAEASREILPFIFELSKPRSVIDVGCGTGEWLLTCQELGVDDLLGIDFHAGKELSITSDQFVVQDLRLPIELGRQFDLAISLEVAEHLPPENACTFIESLTKLAPVVLFSAAVPGQGGTGHINLQWPEYWANLFSRFQFEAIDCVRPRFWECSRVACYYAQNTILYIDRMVVDQYRQLTLLPSFELARFIHPSMWQDATHDLATLRPLFTSRGLIKRLPGALWLSVSERLRRLFDL